MDSANNPAATPRQPLLEVRGVVREFPAGDTPIVVLKDVDLAAYTFSTLFVDPPRAGLRTCV